jgi:hypothetical protein
MGMEMVKLTGDAEHTMGMMETSSRMRMLSFMLQIVVMIFGSHGGAVQQDVQE